MIQPGAGFHSCIQASFLEGQAIGSGFRSLPAIRSRSLLPAVSRGLSLSNRASPESRCLRPLIPKRISTRSSRPAAASGCEAWRRSSRDWIEAYR
jgi:hypothetical protein